MKHLLDAKRLLCTMPVIRLQNHINKLNIGDEVEVTCTDPGTLHDIPTWCRINGHTVLNTTQDKNEVVFWVRKN